MSQELKGGADLKLDAGFDTVSKGDEHLVNTYKNAEAFAENLPGTVTKKVIKELKSYEKDFNRAVLSASVEKATEQFKKDKKVQIVENKFQSGLSSHDSTNVVIRRAVAIKSGFGADAETIMVPQIKMKVKSTGTVGKTELKKCQAELAESLK